MGLRRLAWWTLGGLALLAALALAALFYASHSETMLRWGIARYASRLPCALSLEGLRGTLNGPLRAQRVACESADLRVEARDVLLQWAPWQLARHRLEISRLQAASVVYTDKKPGGGLDPPTRLALPLAVRLDSLEVDRFAIARGAKPIEVGSVAVSVESDTTGLRVRRLRLAGAWGSGEGEATLGAQAPLPLQARMRVEGVLAEGWPIEAHLQLSGPLAQPVARIEGFVRGMPLSARMQLEPFTEDPVRSIGVRSTAFDLAAFDPRLPVTALRVELDAAAQRLEALEGELRVVNPEPGPLDRKRLPLERLHSRLRLTAHSFELQEASFGFGAGGEAVGYAGLYDGVLRLDVGVRRLDLRRLHSSLRATRLEGRLRAQGGREWQQVSGRLREKGVAMEGEARIANDRVEIARLLVRAGGAQAAVSGQVELDTRLAFSLRGALRRFDPGRFGDFPKADLNGFLQARGALRPQWQAQVQYRLARSRYLGQALGGEGTLNLTPRRISNAELRFALGPNVLVLRGSFGAPADALRFDVRAPRLEALGLGFAGALSAAGTVAGTASRPSLEARVEASNIVYNGYRVARWSAQGRLEQGEDPRLELRSRLARAARGDLKLATLELTADGTLSSHAIELKVEGHALEAFARLQGAWSQEHSRWSGVLERLENAGDYALRMRRPAPLRVARHFLELGATQMQFQQTEIALGETVYRNGELSTSGSVAGVRLSRLLALLPHPPAVQSTLTLGARWSLRAGEKVDATLEIAREGGDLLVPGEEPLALGLEEARLVLRAVANRLDADLTLRGAAVQARAQAQTMLERRGARWGVPGSAPLKLNASAQLRSIGTLAPLVGAAVSAAGSLSVRLEADGTVAQPGLRGTVAGEDLAVEHVAGGIFLRDGVLRAHLADGVLTLGELRLRGGEGTFSARGELAARGDATQIGVEWSARKLAIVQHPDLRLTVSGAGTLKADEGRIALAGALTADRGRVELRSEAAPGLGGDVVVAGREQPESVTARLLPSELDLALDLGPDFRVAGRGLDAQLAGTVRLTGASGAALAARGEIRTVRGTYAAYGQKLSIEQGLFHFSGPVGNPALQIRALRKDQPVQAGVEVTGTARTPLVRLISNPEVPDPEKLAWLVLGRRVESGNTADAQTLQASAVALAAGLGTAPLQRQLARVVGLDELRLAAGSEGTQGGVVAVGKRITERVYMSYERSLGTALGTLRTSYQLSKRWSLRAESGQTDAVDLFFTISFH
ncbi:MAG TPA: translocation/assembly module TamB domain-containing protein [Burkholderiales bacterium]|nr:translocation/assembly module TamB domain-containing protein [Burkholderiales bacterium]